ncbi:MAG: hypothetical protein AAGF99_02700 [Bacteroidota bacterium]
MSTKVTKYNDGSSTQANTLLAEIETARDVAVEAAAILKGGVPNRRSDAAEFAYYIVDANGRLLLGVRASDAALIAQLAVSADPASAITFTRQPDNSYLIGGGGLAGATEVPIDEVPGYGFAVMDRFRRLLFGVRESDDRFISNLGIEAGSGIQITRRSDLIFEIAATGSGGGGTAAGAVAVGHVDRGRMFSLPLASRTTGDGYVWSRIPTVPRRSVTLRNTTAETLLVRRAMAAPEGVRYQGTWSASGSRPTQPTNSQNFLRGDFWHTATAGTSLGETFAVGDRLVFIALRAPSSGHPYTETENTYERIEASELSLCYRGNWAPVSAYPSDANLRPGDYYEVSQIGTFDGVTYAVGDRLLRTQGDSWRRIPSPEIYTVAPGGSITIDGDGPVEWRRQDGDSGTVYPYADVAALDTVSAWIEDDADTQRRLVRLLDEVQGTQRTLDVGAGYEHAEVSISEDGLWLTVVATNGAGTVQRTYATVDTATTRAGVERQVGNAQLITYVGDSMANQLVGKAGSTVADRFTTLGLVAPTELNLGEASQNTRQITDQIIAEVRGAGNALNQGAFTGLTLLFLDRGINPACVADGIEALQSLPTPVRRSVVMGLFQGREMNWTGSVLEATNGIGNGEWDDVIRLESEALAVFGELFVNVRQILFEAQDGDLPDPQFPGDTQSTSFQARGVYPIQYASFYENQGTFLAQQAAMTQARFQGYTNAVPGTNGTEAGQYVILTGSGVIENGRASNTGDVVVWDGSAWVACLIDPTHLNADGNTVLANHFVDLLEAFGWIAAPQA